MATTEQRAAEHFSTLVRGFDHAMLITTTDDGMLHARPMAVAEIDDDGDLWFVTSQLSSKVDEVIHDNRALVVMQGDHTYLSIHGHAEVERDPGHVERIWSEKLRVWFPDEYDPDLVLLHVYPEQAEYWDAKGTSGLAFAMKVAKSYLTGRDLPSDDVEAHGKVTL